MFSNKFSHLLGLLLFYVVSLGNIGTNNKTLLFYEFILLLEYLTQFLVIKYVEFLDFLLFGLFLLLVLSGKFGRNNFIEMMKQINIEFALSQFSLLFNLILNFILQFMHFLIKFSNNLR